MENLDPEEKVELAIEMSYVLQFVLLGLRRQYQKTKLRKILEEILI